MFERCPLHRPHYEVRCSVTKYKGDPLFGMSSMAGRYDEIVALMAEVGYWEGWRMLDCGVDSWPRYSYYHKATGEATSKVPEVIRYEHGHLGA